MIAQIGTLKNNANYNLAKASYVNNFDATASIVRAGALWFSPDGVYLFVININGSATNLRRYTLSTPWNIVTCGSLVSNTFTGISGYVQGLYIDKDGYNLYISYFDSGYTVGKIYQYTMSTPWDVSMLTQVRNLGINGKAPQNIAFKPDGTKMFFANSYSPNREVLCYTLSTPWNLDTASFNNNFSVITQNDDPSGLSFSGDGYKMFVSKYNYTTYQYNLTKAWDISTAVYANKSFASGSQENALTSTFFKQPGDQFYTCGVNTHKYYQYKIS